MIVSDKQATFRLSSPMNLMNKLKTLSSPRKSAMSLFIPPASQEKIVSFNPFVNKPPENLEAAKSESSQPLTPTTAIAAPITSPTPTTINDILENHDSQIKLGLAHDKALELLNNSVALLATKLEDVRADKLPSVISAASKTVESIRRERAESSKNNKDREVHYHFYTPQQKTVADYEVIDVVSA